MTPDISDTDDDHSTGTKTFRPPVDDYFRRHVRDDHAPNAALHDALQAGKDPEDHSVVYNLMASHAPGEKDHKPRYHVRVSIKNHGGGDANLHDAEAVGRLVDREDVTIVNAWSGSTWSIEEDDVDGVDDVHDVMREYHADRLELQIRPVETRVEPVEVPYRWIPEEYVKVGPIDDAEDAVEAARTLLDRYDVDHPVEPTGYAHDGDTRTGVPYDTHDGDGEGDCTGDDSNAIVGECAACGARHEFDPECDVCMCGGTIEPYESGGGDE